MRSDDRYGPFRVRTRGLSLIEAMMAMAVLSVAVLAVNHAVVVGQSHTRAGGGSMRAMDLVADLMEEILALPYRDPDGSSSLGPETGELVRADFDNTDDFHTYVEVAGGLTDFAGNLLDSEAQAYGRSVSIVTANQFVTAFNTTITGLSVTVTVTDVNGQVWSLTRFVPEFAP